MPRRPRLAAGDLAYHVLNRRVEVKDKGQVLPAAATHPARFPTRSYRLFYIAIDPFLPRK